MVNTDEKAARQLNDVRRWAKAKVDSGLEPPWAWYQYMKLIETADAILTSAEAVTTENCTQSAPQSDAHLRLVDSTSEQDSAPHRPAGLTTQLPM